MKFADLALGSRERELAWLGQKGDLGLPKFLPPLPKPQQARLERFVEREAVKFWKGSERAHKARAAKKRKRRTRKPPRAQL